MENLSNQEAEQAILGAIIMEPTIIADIDLAPEHFYRPSHQKIFSTMMDLHDLGEPVDIVTITERLKEKGKIDSVGGTGYLTSLITQCVTTVNFELHSRVVRDLSTKRAIISTCQDVMVKVNNGVELEEVVSLMAVEVDVKKKSVVKVDGIARETYRQIIERSKNRDSLSGVRTGFLKLDLTTDGLQNGDLIIVAGRPGMGKTAFAGQITTSADVWTHFVSVEMKNSQLAIRMLSGMSDVESWKIRKGLLSPQDITDLGIATEELAKKNITFDDVSYKLYDIRRSIIQAHRMGARLVIVDYIQLIKNKADSREREIGEISTMLKNTAKQLDIPIIALAQLNRDVEKRENKRPMLSDLRDSGQIEQDADIIIFLYRDGYYKKDIEDNTAEIIVAKGRNIGTDTIVVGWDGKRTKFESMEF